MSRKMIDYQVDNGKISTIDGYKVGGEELHYKTIYTKKIFNYSVDSDIATKLADGSLFQYISHDAKLSDVVSAEDLELIKKAKNISVIGVASITKFGDNDKGRMITQPSFSGTGSTQFQGYIIRTRDDGNLWLSYSAVAYVQITDTVSYYDALNIPLACKIEIAY